MGETVVAVPRHRGRMLLVRSGDRWSALAAPLGDGTPETVARRLVHERLGVETTAVRSATLRLDGRTLRPVLLDVDASDDPAGGVPAPSDGTDWEHGRESGPEREPDRKQGRKREREREREREWEWIHPPAILRRETTPELWRAYERVGPTVRTVVADDEHGSTWLSVRALEVLRDRAGLLAVRGPDDDAAEWAELADLAGRLRTARPGMAAVENRVNRAMATAAGTGAERERTEPGATAAAVETAAVEGVERAVEADREAARLAAERVDGRSVLTLSRSGTVLSALRAGDPAAVYVAESRPAREGVGVAETLARSGTRVVLHSDAAVGTVVAERADLVLVGADAVRPDGAVVNKTGTRTVAAVAAREDVPLYVVAASDKVATGPVRSEAGPGRALYDGAAPLETYDPTFDTTPAGLVDGLVTERGVLPTEGVADLVGELRALARWDGTEDGDPDDGARDGEQSAGRRTDGDGTESGQPADGGTRDDQPDGGGTDDDRSDGDGADRRSRRR